MPSRQIVVTLTSIPLRFPNLSGMAWLNGTKVRVNGLPRPVCANTRFDKVAALTDPVEQGINRDKADRLAVGYLRRDAGVWP